MAHTSFMVYGPFAIMNTNKIMQIKKLPNQVMADWADLKSRRGFRESEEKQLSEQYLGLVGCYWKSARSEE